jgi:hypothetical protein
MYRDQAVAIVSARVPAVLRVDGIRFRWDDQLGLGLANLELLELCRGLGPVRRA